MTEQRMSEEQIKTEWRQQQRCYDILTRDYLALLAIGVVVMVVVFATRAAWLEQIPWGDVIVPTIALYGAWRHQRLNWTRGRVFAALMVILLVFYAIARPTQRLDEYSWAGFFLGLVFVFLFEVVLLLRCPACEKLVREASTLPRRQGSLSCPHCGAHLCD